ncbi:hypothetical protein Emed_005754 [Eimeria media]
MGENKGLGQKEIRENPKFYTLEEANFKRSEPKLQRASRTSATRKGDHDATAHDHPTAGRTGVHKTHDHLARFYFWPGMRAYVKTYVESCARCRAAKHISSTPQGLQQSLRIPNRRWSTVSLDFIIGLPMTPQQHDAILTMVDTVSNMAHFVSTTSTVTAGVVRLLSKPAYLHPD